MRQRKTTPQSHPGVLLAAVCGFVFFGIVAIVGNSEMLYVAAASPNWPSTEGVIQHSAVALREGPEAQSFQPDVAYDYSVNGVRYHGTRIAAGQYGGDSAASAENWAEYRAGQMARVFYDPSRPSRAVLIPGSNWFCWVPVGIAAGMLAFAAPLIVSAVRGLRRQAKA